jgi:alpha-D-ribose 1-methylphosphonate 5-triphosphate synthase subunit PhnH
MSNELSAGFADSVADAQSCFRSVLNAMARPGLLHAVGGVSAPAPLCDAAAAVLLTLADHETPLWLDPAAAGAGVWITFHTGAPSVPPAQATFAMALSLPDLANLSVGTDEMPETSATIVLQVASLTTGQLYVLEGPGLREPKVIAIDGLPPDFIAIWQQNHARYPLGIDLILCAGNQLTALPRSVSIKDA